MAVTLLLVGCGGSGSDLKAGGESRFNSTYVARVTDVKFRNKTITLSFDAQGDFDLRRPETSCIKVTGATRAGFDPEPRDGSTSVDPRFGRNNPSTAQLHAQTAHQLLAAWRHLPLASTQKGEQTMRINTFLRPFATVALAAAMTLLAMPGASAQTGDSTAHSYPGWGQTYSAADLVKQITDNAGKNMVDPAKPLFPSKGMRASTPDNSGASDPSLFDMADPYGAGKWFPKPGSGKASDGKCTVDQEVLKRDVIGAQLAPDGCAVIAGQLYDPSAGSFIDVAKQNTPPVVVPIVGAEYAYGRGGAYLDANARAALMNDPLNLIAVPNYGHEVYGQGLLSTPGETEDGKYTPSMDTNGYMPSDQTLKEAYVLRFLQVMMKHGLALEPNTVERLQFHTKGFTTMVDTSAAGVSKLAKGSFASTVPNVQLPSVQPKAAPSTSASPKAETSPTASPTKTDSNAAGGLSPVLITGVLASLAAAAAVFIYVLSTRKKARQ